MSDVIEPLPPTELTQAVLRVDDEDTEDSGRKGSSAKIEQLVHLLKLTPSSEKSLVFSQFTSFLDKVLTDPLVLKWYIHGCRRSLTAWRAKGKDIQGRL